MNEQQKKHENGVVLLSGGLDSAVCLSIAAKECEHIHPLAFDYRQKTVNRELDCARALAEHYGTRALKVIDLGLLAELTNAALCDAESVVTGGNEYVPFRNGVFLALATALAETVDADIIYIGSTGGDLICSDNSQPFRDAFSEAVRIGTKTFNEIAIAAPLGGLDKEGIVRLALDLGTPLEHTWSCHNNIDEACCVCSNCISRLAAFEAVGATDPVTITRV